MRDKARKAIDTAVTKLSDEMLSDSTKRYFQELDKITHKMLLRELSRPIEDPMRPVAGVRYAEFIEYGVTPPHSIPRAPNRDPRGAGGNGGGVIW